MYPERNMISAIPSIFALNVFTSNEALLNITLFVDATLASRFS